MLIRAPVIGSMAVTSHDMPWLIVMHVVFRSLLKILEYAAKQACKQLQCNKAKLLEPASINGLHIHRG